MSDPALPGAPPTAGLGANVQSGFMVFLIALPLCLGIAMASGFPPVAGVLTAIVGGLVGTWLGSAELTIKGPAAGLIVIVLGAVQELGQGDPVLGYRRTLAVGVVAAVLQIGLALSRAGVLASGMPPSVVHGMLAAIGVIIIAKQTPVMLGVRGAGGEPLEMLAHLPQYIRQANPSVVAVGGLALALLVLLPRVRALRRVPAPVVVLAMTVPLGLALKFGEAHTYVLGGQAYALGPEWLVQLPGSLVDAVTFPDFSAVGSGASLRYVAMFTLVGSIESLLSVLAVDAMDPRKRVSDLNRDLLATGAGNLLAACVGGLPMISEIVRSKANIDAGANARWSNFFHAVFLLGFVALLPGLLEQIPLAALAAMLVYTGARLASPREFRHAWKVGPDQLLVFGTTFGATLAADLLVGVGAGLAVKLGLHVLRGAELVRLFRNPPTVVREGTSLRIALSGPAVFTNLVAVRALLGTVEPDIEEVVLDLSEVTLVDHTFLDKVNTAAQELPRARLTLVGLQELRPASAHPFASRRRVLGGGQHV